MFTREPKSIPSNKSRMYIYLVLGALMLWAVYENEITSLAIVNPAPKSIQSLKEVLDQGYKILVVHLHYYQLFEVHLDEFNYKRKLNNSLVVKESLSLGNRSEYAYWLSSKRKHKYAMQTDTGFSTRNKLETQKLLREVHQEMESNCFVVPQEFRSTIYFWEIYMVNR